MTAKSQTLQKKREGEDMMADKRRDAYRESRPNTPRRKAKGGGFWP